MGAGTGPPMCVDSDSGEHHDQYFCAGSRVMRIDVNGIALEVQVSGEGPAVLLVHGFPDTHACWRHQVAALNAAGYQTIAPDLRGFGASDKPEDLESYKIAAYAGDLIGVLD